MDDIGSEQEFGLPSETSAFEDIAKSDQRISVVNESRRYGKIITLVSGFDKTVDVKVVAKGLKAGLACGGTVKDGVIELQGNHRKQVRSWLIKQGFPDEAIVD